MIAFSNLMTPSNPVFIGIWTGWLRRHTHTPKKNTKRNTKTCCEDNTVHETLLLVCKIVIFLLLFKATIVLMTIKFLFFVLCFSASSISAGLLSHLVSTIFGVPRHGKKPRHGTSPDVPVLPHLAAEILTGCEQYKHAAWIKLCVCAPSDETKDELFLVQLNPFASRLWALESMSPSQREDSFITDDSCCAQSLL